MNNATDRMKAELWSNLSAMVEAGDITDAQANEWFVMKTDQWKDGI